MFEESLFTSKVQVRPMRLRWAAVVAVVVQGLAVAGLLLVPMLRPLALPMLRTAPVVVSVNLRKPEIKVERVKVQPAVQTTSSAVQIPVRAAEPVIETRGGGRISVQAPNTESGPVLLASGPGMGVGMGTGVGIEIGESTAPVVRVKSSAPVRVSLGISSGLLLEPMRPLYPAIARAAGVQGTVVIAARIDRTGRIVGAQVTSGPGMLRNAALAAVESARYRPYLLNGEATEVETTIVVNFRIGG